MLSVRHDGASIPEVVGIQLGNGFKQFMRVFSVILLVLVGVVFVKGPASILNGLTGVNVTVLLLIIFAYYLIATVVPVDKLIGKIYPIFGICLLIMAVGIGFSLLFKGYEIPEVYSNFGNMHSAPLQNPIFPFLFITIACGAISGFHATQSPLMARCITNEKQGRQIFYGSMIAEGVVALIWAAAAMAFFGGVNGLASTMAEGHNAAWVVNEVSNGMLGKVGGFLAILGVVACPITSGDTAFRSARLTIADSFKFKQKTLVNRFIIAIPMFVVGYILTLVDFNIIWRYFGWSNQTLATIVLWTAAMYLAREGKNFWMAAVPATFMTAVCTTFIFVSKIGFGVSISIATPIGVVGALLALIIFIKATKKIK